MPVMLSKTYDALKAAGAPEDKAREAAEELAGYENRLASIDGRLASLEGKFTVMLWAMGINAAATIAIGATAADPRTPSISMPGAARDRYPPIINAAAARAPTDSTRSSMRLPP